MCDFNLITKLSFILRKFEIRNKEMDSQILNDKLDLIQWLSSIEDKAVIKKLIEFRKRETKDWWNEISDAEKSSIEKGINQADNGELEPHSKARKLYGKWL